MNKINNGAIMNKSAENPATTHTHNRYKQAKKTSIEEKKYVLKQGYFEVSL